ncbi:hypothetical protein MIND_01167500 [Mycena indigotica]|uniref:Uncharacterized protein n=1 Tax=Mycena indigotica TaxID=2126181 RepID=A0A8H6S4N8_9AGAR|nr:uncharacterized protein MIND_01167500 [Mycena indigotica]KAF7292693.1 hypothetical protein MIND_01167500 [Mycena indigotica]
MTFIIFTRIHSFSPALRELLVSGIVLPSTFFDTLYSLRQLRCLTVNQCVVPPPPNSPATALRLSHLTLAHLSPYSSETLPYSPYFTHLVPEIPNLLISEVTINSSIANSKCAPSNLTIGGGLPIVTPWLSHYFSCLNGFSLHNLRRLDIIIPRLYRPPSGFKCASCSVNMPTQSLPYLQAVTAPLFVLDHLISATSTLEHVSVQGPIPPRVAIRLVDRLSWTQKSMKSFAVATAVWDDDVLTRVTLKLPALERLEYIYCSDNLSPRSWVYLRDTCLPRLHQLTTLRLHRFPMSRRVCELRLSKNAERSLSDSQNANQNWKASAAVVQHLRQGVEDLSLKLPALISVCLPGDFESGKEWCKASNAPGTAQWSQVTHRLNVEWGCVRPLDDHLRIHPA